MKKNLLRGIITATLLTVSLAAFSNPVDVNSAKEIGKKFLTNSVKAFAGVIRNFFTYPFRHFIQAAKPAIGAHHAQKLFVFTTNPVKAVLEGTGIVI